MSNSVSAADVKAARVAAGLTQQAAADLVGVSVKSWEAYEGGWRNIQPPTWRLFQLLAKPSE